jgi:outer membrane protein OmpA-like peptidoglycan-associated protein
MNTKLLMGMGIAALLTACASTPRPNVALENARTMVQTAEADPNVAKYAALDLDAAKKELAVADSAAMHHDDAGVVQPAYLATQTARLAELKASAKADDARVAAGQTDRDKIQLAARTHEVDTAKDARDQASMARDAANEKSARLQAEVDALKAKPTDRGLVLTLGDVLFDTGKAELNPGAARNLDRLVQFLADHPDRLVQIDGFTDSIGTDSYNLDLSQRRADAVKSTLRMRGVDASRISSQGYGKAYPVASNTESGGRQLNRRVEVVIGQDGGGAIASRGG